MPAEVFGPDFKFLSKDQILSFEEIVRVVKVAVSLGVTKVRLTGGEPLLRHGLADLIGMISAIDGVEDLAMTTNGVLLAHRAEELALAGMDRVTVSLDALDPLVFATMNGVGAKVDRVIAGIEAAKVFGLPVKVNAVIKRGVNEQEILPLVKWAQELDLTLRFIEFMDVGETNNWRHDEVVPATEILSKIKEELSLTPIPEDYRGEVAQRWKVEETGGEIGIVTSVSQPFCKDCQRARISAEGQIFTCLFAASGHDLRGLLRGGVTDNVLRETIKGVWRIREDRYSEIRGSVDLKKAEMSYLGG